MFQSSLSYLLPLSAVWAQLASFANGSLLAEEVFNYQYFQRLLATHQILHQLETYIITTGHHIETYVYYYYRSSARDLYYYYRSSATAY